MAQITLTLDLTAETADALRILVDILSKKSGDTAPTTEQLSFDDLPAKTDTAAEKTTKPSKTAKPAKPAAPSDKGDGNPADAPIPPQDDKTDAPKISKTDVRAIALKFSKAGKQATLKQIFAKYGAEKLSDIAESDYPALMADLEAANE